ncbi:hypothetical protein EJ05DRAFT_371850 [Pseudovirgaria hyperparasitica]|uniref:Uncharacterized protein n=1 Tax=Pseudovirgaria hyperparasitica TaxID=470096 RepID=A0A6A6W4R4_9PEZI|nr:uncharacterized protein EJ05DRAFT_371850 [Pseudovirgaria hyperparasitica]KAF2757918.1 hypothetical protein EJ05DRAFT_371850 [Pseudovirgaria hyperparasitica]
MRHPLCRITVNISGARHLYFARPKPFPPLPVSFNSISMICLSVCLFFIVQQRTTLPDRRCGTL